VTAVGREAADERKRAGTGKEQLKAATKRKRIPKASTMMNETDAKWRRSFGGLKLEKQRKKKKRHD